MIDAWSSTPPPAQAFRRDESAFTDRLTGSLRRLNVSIREATSHLFTTAGIRLKPGRMIVEQSLDVEGDLAATGSTRIDGTLDVGAQTTIGGTLGVTGATTLGAATSVTGALGVTGNATFSGDTEIGGNARITGTLSLPAGIIDNEALASPVAFNADWGSGDAYGTPAGLWLEVASASITIPAGFTKMQFTAAGMANGLNSAVATANMYVQIRRTVNGAGSFTSQQGQVALPAGFQGVASTFYLWNEAVVPGEVHRFALRVWTSGAFAASEYNYARVDVAALFGR